MENTNKLRWLLFFYSLPATPVNNRVKIWRKLTKTGALQLKGGVYILPNREEHHEALQWLLAELPGLKGEGLLISTERIEPLQDEEIVALFNEQRHSEYQEVGKKIEEFSGRMRNLRKGGKDKKPTSLFRQYEKIYAEFQTVQHRDFFQSESGLNMASLLNALRKQLEEFSVAKKDLKGSALQASANRRKLQHFSGLTWLTRKRPFVDRMASAWLIRRFIDEQATFDFRDEPELHDLRGEHEVSFDVRNGDFTHIDDLCTFEVLLKNFELTEQGLTYLAEIVHNIDMKDGKFSTPEAHAIEMILKGVRKKALPDGETLEQGMAIFEALYLSITEKP